MSNLNDNNNVYKKQITKQKFTDYIETDSVHNIEF